MAMNRYQGNSGRVEQVPDRTEPLRQEVFYRSRELQPTQSARPPRLHKEVDCGGLGILDSLSGSIQDKLGTAFSKLTELETEDIILLLIIYLMYRETGDEQYLIILGLLLIL